MSRDNLIKGRVSLKHHFYHVTTCTANRLPFFTNLQCGRLLVNEMQRLHYQQQLNSVTWVVMPDHLHWLFQLTANNSLSTVMKTLKGRSANAINRYNPAIRFAWQRGFYDQGIRHEANLKQVSRYIVANPLRAGLVANVANYALWDSIYLA